MKNFMLFSETVQSVFKDEDNMKAFHGLLLNAGRGIYANYSKEETNNIIRNGFNKILGIDYRTANQHDRRQAMRKHAIDIYELIEDTLVDHLTSGWDETNSQAFRQFVDDIIIGEGDKMEFYVEDNSLLTVSKWAGNHHDVNFKSYSVRIA